MIKSFLKCLILVWIFANVNCDICPMQDLSIEAQEFNEPCFDLQKFEYDTNKKAQQYMDTELNCYVKNKGSYSVAWMHENELLSLDDKVIKPDKNIKLETDSSEKFNLKITNVDTKHKGSYRCQISTLVAKNLEYNLDILIPPTITRIPNSDVIMLNEGESITIQCLTQGNPKPKISWSKKGEKAIHTTIDESKSILNLQDVEEAHSDTYSCTSKNGVGNPVTSEFQILIKFKPKVFIMPDENINKSIMYSALERKEKIRCLVKSYPKPKITLLHNDLPLPSQAYSIDEIKETDDQYSLTYNFVGSDETFGNYICLAENELGSSKASIKISGLPSEVTITNEKLPVYSDGAIFEWSSLSGSPIQELNVEIFSENNTNVTNLITKTKQFLADGTELPPTYHHENIQFRDFYDVVKLIPNASYTIRIRVKNYINEWSEWSSNLTIRTHSDENEKIIKHKSNPSHNHRHHDKKHKNYGASQAGSTSNSKRERYNSYLSNQNKANSLNQIKDLTIIGVLISGLILMYISNFQLS